VPDEGGVDKDQDTEKPPKTGESRSYFRLGYSIPKTLQSRGGGYREQTPGLRGVGSGQYFILKIRP